MFAVKRRKKTVDVFAVLFLFFLVLFHNHSFWFMNLLNDRLLVTHFHRVNYNWTSNATCHSFISITLRSFGTIYYCYCLWRVRYVLWITLRLHILLLLSMFRRKTKTRTSDSFYLFCPLSRLWLHIFPINIFFRLPFYLVRYLNCSRTTPHTLRINYKCYVRTRRQFRIQINVCCVVCVCVVELDEANWLD